MAEKLLETIEATASRLSVSRSQVYNLLNDKQLDGVKIGRAHRVVVDSSLRYVERLKSGANSSPLETTS